MRGMPRCFAHGLKGDTRRLTWRVTDRNEEMEMMLVVVSGYYSAPSKRG